MKASLIAFGCILIGAVACTAPQGKKLSANGGGAGLPAVAEGPGGSATEPSIPATHEAAVSEHEKGKTIGVYNQGTITVTLEAAQASGYSWRLAEIPDPTVLKLVSQDYTPPASGEGRGEEKWVFQAVGPGDVNVKMWYGNTRESALSGNPGFDFVASVSDQTKHEKKTTTTAKKPIKKA
jgi:predicted secreted protein